MMRSMRRAALALSVFFAQPAFAASWPVVEVTSTRCSHPQTMRKGSGIVVTTPRGLRVVTSPEVVFAGTKLDDVCTQIKTAAGTSMDAAFIGSNALRDLALLAVESPAGDADPVVQAAISLEQIGSTVVDPNSLVVMAGIPFASHSVQAVFGGQVLPPGDRAILPLQRVSAVFAMAGFSFSGGGVFTYDGRLQGMISHRFLDIQLAKPTIVRDRPATEEGRSGSGAELTLFVEAKAVHDWVLALEGGDAGAVMNESLRDEWAGRHGLSVAGLHFVEKDCSSGAARLDSQNGAGGIGGGWGVGVGGGWGVGVGGKAPYVVESCEIEVTLDPASAVVAWPFPENRSALILKAALQSTGSAYVSTLRHAAGIDANPDDLLGFFIALQQGFVAVPYGDGQSTPHYIGTALFTAPTTDLQQFTFGRSRRVHAVEYSESSGCSTNRGRYLVVFGKPSQDKPAMRQSLSPVGLSVDGCEALPDGGRRCTVAVNGGSGALLDWIAVNEELALPGACAVKLAIR